VHSHPRGCYSAAREYFAHMRSQAWDRMHDGVAHDLYVRTHTHAHVTLLLVGMLHTCAHKRGNACMMELCMIRVIPHTHTYTHRHIIVSVRGHVPYVH